MGFMKRLLAIALLGTTTLSWGAACCGVEGLRSYFSLQELQNYDLSLSSSFQEVTGWYNPQGRIEKKTGPSYLIFQTSSLARLNPNLEAFSRFPFVFRTQDAGALTENRLSLGDVQAGFRLTLHRSLFVEDLFPTISLVVGSKFPTGISPNEAVPFLNSQMGNRLWEPLVGLSFRKEYYDWMGSIDASFSRSMGNILGRSWEANQVNLTESFSYAVVRELNVGMGGQQTWILSDKNSKVFSVFASANYFVSQFTTLGLQTDWSLPFDHFATNQPVSRSLGLIVRYGFY